MSLYFAAKVTVAKPKGPLLTAMKALGADIIQLSLKDVADVASDEALQSHSDQVQRLAVTLEAVDHLGLSFCSSARLAVNALSEIAQKGSRQFKHVNSAHISRCAGLIVVGCKSINESLRVAMRTYLDSALPLCISTTKQMLDAIADAHTATGDSPVRLHLDETAEAAQQFLDDVANPFAVAMSAKFMIDGAVAGDITSTRDRLHTVCTEKLFWCSTFDKIVEQSTKGGEEASLDTEDILRAQAGMQGVNSHNCVCTIYHRDLIQTVPNCRSQSGPFDNG